MTIDERIKYAEKKRNEAICNDCMDSVTYWNGYIDGLKAAQRDANG
jgi:hypothetical protein